MAPTPPPRSLEREGVRAEIGLGLVLFDEPRRLRERLGALAREGPENAREVVRRMVSALWRRWGEELMAADVRRAQLSRTANGYEREIWLWALGDRPWSQMLEGLRGRILRRVG